MDVTIPDLPPGAAPVSSSPFESVEGGTSVRYTIAQIGAALSSGGAFLPITGGTLTGNLGINQSPPLSLFDARRSTDGEEYISVRNDNAGAAALTDVQAHNGTNAINITMTGTGYSGVLGAGVTGTPDTGYLRSNATGALEVWSYTAPIRFRVGSTERMHIDASGNVNIGQATGVADAILDIAQNRDAKAVVSINNPNGGAFAYSGFAASNGAGHGTGLYHYGAGFDPLPPQHADGAYLFTTGNGGITFNTLTATPIYFATNSTERMRITADGFFKASNNGAYSFNSYGIHEFNTDNNSKEALSVVHSGTLPSGFFLKYSNAAPNTGGVFFARYDDTTTTRTVIYSNGGIANYQSNNTNLSDAAVKANITPYTDSELDALSDSFKSVQWCKYKYLDQTHDDWNHGYVAQDIETAFAKTAPELVDETEVGAQAEGTLRRRCVYDTDLTHIGLALLARSLKKIAELEARLAKAGVPA